MVNASLNWASIVGIVLAVGGAFLYFMRNFKPALARDYDVFFAAVGLLCGGILFFQGWRLDPILQFGQFLLAGTTVFFAYESVRLRGVTTEQARRSSYFEDEEPAPFRPRGGLGGGRSWEEEPDRFDEPTPLRRRFRSREEGADEDFYRPRRTSRAAIPERALSRRDPDDRWDGPAADGARGGRGAEPPREERPGPGRYSAGGPSPSSEFGSRRRDRDERPETRRGSRPLAEASDGVPRSSRRPGPTGANAAPTASPRPAAGPSAGIPEGSPLRSRSGESGASDAEFTPLERSARPAATGPSGQASPGRPPANGAPGPSARPRDNSSRFDD